MRSYRKCCSPHNENYKIRLVMVHAIANVDEFEIKRNEGIIILLCTESLWWFLVSKMSVPFVVQFALCLYVLSNRRFSQSVRLIVSFINRFAYF